MGNPLSTLYKKLVDSGKINEAEKILEKLFLEKSGTKLLNEQNLPLKVYHGTEKSFNSFDLSRIGSANDPGFYGRGFYFSPNKAYAETYGPLREFFVKMNSPFKAFTPETSKASLLFNQKDDSFNFMVDEATINKFKEDLLKSDGVWHNSIAPIRGDNKIIQEIVVPTPNQIKSPKVTFDNEGNLIPLDLRYDFSNPDFRFKAGGILKFQNPASKIKAAQQAVKLAIEEVKNPTIINAAKNTAAQYNRFNSLYNTGLEAYYPKGFRYEMPDIKFSVNLSSEGTNSPSKIIEPSGIAHLSSNMIELPIDKWKMPENYLYGAPFHEGLHITRYGAGPAANWKAKFLFKTPGNINPYFTSGIEVGAYARQLAKKLGIEFGQPYPGDMQFDNLFFENGKGGPFYYMNMETPKAKKRVWSLLNGTFLKNGGKLK